MAVKPSGSPQEKTMRVRMKQDILARFHDDDNGAKVGQEVELPEIHALRYIAHGICDFVDDAPTPDANKRRHDQARDAAREYALRCSRGAGDNGAA
jgi:hypothetical protein